MKTSRSLNQSLKRIIKAIPSYYTISKIKLDQAKNSDRLHLYIETGCFKRWMLLGPRGGVKLSETI